MIAGIGIDIIEVERVGEKIARDKGFREKIFSQNEISFCELKGENKAQHYAARFAAKEAFLKATGFGLLLGADLSEIEVVNADSGKPSFFLTGNFKDKAQQNQWNKIHLSFAHIQAVACAIVVIES
jgi:holo-[acyl-carrier protein] synthase